MSLLSLSACPYVFMSLPDSTMPPDCSDRLEAPVTDTVIAGAATGIVGTAAIAAATGHSWNITTLLAVVYSAPLILVNGSCAVYGCISRDRCIEQQPRSLSRLP